MPEQTFYDAWMARDDVRRSPRSWKNAEICLCILEACGEPPPLPDAEPPDHEITLVELIAKSREPESPEQEARRAKERQDFDLDDYRRVHSAKTTANRPLWTEFRRRHELDWHPPAA